MLEADVLAGRREDITSATGHLRGLAALTALCEMRPYKGWRFSVRAAYRPSDVFNLGTLLVEYEAPDAYDPSRSRTQQFSCTIPAGIDAADATAGRWLPWLFSVVLFIEAHEAAEFFMPGGERVYDPHDPERDGAAKSFGLGARVLPFVP